MFQIVRKQEMAAGTIIRFDISAPKIAKKIKAGQKFTRTAPNTFALKE